MAIVQCRTRTETTIMTTYTTTQTITIYAACQFEPGQITYPVDEREQTAAFGAAHARMVRELTHAFGGVTITYGKDSYVRQDDGSTDYDPCAIYSVRAFPNSVPERVTRAAIERLAAGFCQDTGEESVLVCFNNECAFIGADDDN